MESRAAHTRPKNTQVPTPGPFPTLTTSCLLMNAQTKGCGDTAIRLRLDPRGWLVSLQWKTLHILHVGQQSSGSNTAREGWVGELLHSGSSCSGNFSSKAIIFPLLTTQPQLHFYLYPICADIHTDPTAKSIRTKFNRVKKLNNIKSALHK